MPRRSLPPSRRILLATVVATAMTLLPISAGPVAAELDNAGPVDRQQQYAAAAAEYGVPESVLLGVSYLQSRWDTNAGTPSTGGGFGPMHLTDAAYVDGLSGVEHYDEGEDPRGDDSREPSAVVDHPEADPPAEAALQTLDAAATLTGIDKDTLRSDAAANIRGGAALLASYQREVGAPVGAGSDPAAWYGAVARYSGADTEDAAAAFADEVYGTIRDGETRVTDDGQRLALAARPVTPEQSWLGRLGLRKLARPDGLECPAEVACEWLPAPYALRGTGTNPASYGNHDLGNRPAQQKIEYIIIHDAEGYYGPTTRLAQDKNWVSWHYTLRSVDGQVAQHVKAKDVAWQAGNWYVNTKSVGIEHEGFAATGTWFTETSYRTSAKLVRYLAQRLGIPLDRQHILGHDNVPGTLAGNMGGMHWDPGPYFDWAHYFELLKAPFHSTATAQSGLVTIDPDYAANQPAFYGCGANLPKPPGGEKPPVSTPCPPHGSSSVLLRSAPRHDAPLVNDLAKKPNGAPATMLVSDHGARASAGQQYAIADREGDWTAIWYLGQKAWFHNPAAAPTAKWSTGFVVTPKPGRSSVPLYGRAYPEAAAYPAGVPVQPISPLQYTFAAGQRYALGGILPSEYYRATTFDGSSPGDFTVIRGETRYVQLQFGHRVMYANLDDVQILPAAVGSAG